MLLCLSLLLVAVPAQAQDTSTLVETLSLIPPAVDIPFSDTPPPGSWSGMLFYTDWEAMLNVRGVSARPADFDELADLPDEIGDLYAAATLFAVNNPGVAADIRFIEMEQVGFDLRSFGQLVAIGNPPSDALLIRGPINTTAFIEARTAAGFMVERETGGSGWGGAASAVLCSEDGCDQGRALGIENRRNGDPFYGNLGQRPPIYIREDLAFSTRDLPQFDAAVSVIEGESASLMDDPNFRTAADAISADLTVTQAMFAFPAVIGTVSEAFLYLSQDAPDLEARLAEAEAAFTPIPAYSVVAFGAGVRADQEITQIVLVYSSEADAQAAGEVIADRINTAITAANDRRWSELFEERGMVLAEPIVFTSETTGLSATVLEFSASLPTVETAAEERFSRLQASDRGYELLSRGLFTRDLAFLAISF